MRILQIINKLGPGGAEKLVFDSIPRYQKEGLSVDLLILKNHKTPFISKLSKVSNGTITGLTTKSIYNPLLIFKIIPYLNKYEVVHFHLFPTIYWVVIAKILSFSKVKLIYTEHSTNNRRRNFFFLKITDRYIYKKIDKIITIADEVDLNLKKHLKLNDCKFQIINNGIDIESYNTAIPYPKNHFFKNEDFILIQVSTFRWQKDQKTLIKSLLHLPNNIKLLLAGDGPLLNESKDLVQTLDLNERVMFLGDRDDIPRLLNTSDVVILSSIHEGLSLSNIEGMSVNKPFIGSDVPGVREIVRGYGLLFEQSNDKQLAELILNLYNDSKLYNKIAIQCLEQARNFDIRKMIAQHIKLYNEVINARK